MKHITLLAVIAGLLGGPVVCQVLADYDDHYAKQADWQENKQATRHCQSCNPDECLKPTGCVAGIVKDPCHCCDVCGKAEFELCDHPQVNTFHDCFNFIYPLPPLHTRSKHTNPFVVICLLSERIISERHRSRTRKACQYVVLKTNFYGKWKRNERIQN